MEMSAKSQDRYSRFNGAPAAAIGIYQTPGSNAVDVARRVRETMNDLADALPRTISLTPCSSTPRSSSRRRSRRSIRTLVVAIVLVALVVFLFLGRLRTTLIPLVAVPVSIVGTFAVMLLIGYSANTVSLLALVLAIGIVVDDAIVVVENVERVIEEESGAHRAGGVQEGHGRDYRPHHRHHPRVVVGVRAGGLHPRHQRAAFPPIRGGGVGVDADLGAQCADLEPGALRGAAQARPEEPRPDALRAWRRSTASATAMSRWCAGWCAWRSSASWSWPDGWRLPRGCSAGPRRASCRKRTRARSLPRCGFPKAPRINRTEAVVKQVEDIVRPIPGVQGVLSVVGLNFIDYIASSNQAFFVIRLKPYEERTDPGAKRRRDHCAAAAADGGDPRAPSRSRSTCRPFSAWAAPAASNTCWRRCRGSRLPISQRRCARLVVAANGQPELAGVYSTYAADTPQIYLDIDRDKAQVLGVKITDIFNALQSTLGSFYVNDFNVFGRTWQVNIQAETPFRDNVDDIYRIYVRNAQGEMVPMRALADAKLVQGPQTVVRYNGFRAAIVNGAAKPGYSSGQALAAMERISAATLPPGYSFEWTGTALQEKAASGRTGIVLGLAVLFAYLFLVALYESWNIPVPALLSVSVGDPGRDRRGDAGRTELRRLRADRAGRADRARRKERHSDRRVCGGAAPSRQGHPGRGHRSRGLAVSSGDDDELRLHPRSIATRHCAGRRRDHAPCGRHAGIRRHDCALPVRHFHHSAALHNGGTVARADGSWSRIDAVMVVHHRRSK